MLSPVRGVPALPDGWDLVSTAGPGRFTTRAVLRRPDGTEFEWTSRRHRKHQGLAAITVPEAGPGSSRPPERVPVARRTWWIASLFSLGSLCFAVGTLPAYVDNVSSRVDGLTFFIGSIFFTAASYLCFAEVANSPDHVLSAESSRRGFRPAAWRPRSVDWWATGVQLVGTVFFNVTTFAALNANWSDEQQRRLVWRPDVMGSICFLVASYLAWAEVCHSAGRLRLRDASWWVVVLNLLGSIAFGLSAVGAFVVPSTGDVANIRWDEGGTILGAVCFLIGAVMLVPEARSARSPV